MCPQGEHTVAMIVKEGQHGYDEHAELKIEFTHVKGRKTLAMMTKVGKPWP